MARHVPLNRQFDLAGPRFTTYKKRKPSNLEGFQWNRRAKLGVRTSRDILPPFGNSRLSRSRAMLWPEGKGLFIMAQDLKNQASRHFGRSFNRFSSRVALATAFASLTVG